MEKQRNAIGGDGGLRWLLPFNVTSSRHVSDANPRRRRTYLLLRSDAPASALHRPGEHGHVQRELDFFGPRTVDHLPRRAGPGGPTAAAFHRLGEFPGVQRFAVVSGLAARRRALDGRGQRPGVGQLVQDGVEEVVEELVHVRRL